MAKIAVSLPQAVNHELRKNKFLKGTSITEQVITALVDAWGWTGEQREEALAVYARSPSEDDGVDVLDRCT